MSAPSKPLFPSYTPWLILLGIALGWGGAMAYSLAEPKLFESVAICRPVWRPADHPGVSERQWLEDEAAAIKSGDNLGRTAARLNLMSEWFMTPDECVKRMRRMVATEVATDPGAVRVVARSTKSMESADLANALVAARIDFWQEQWTAEQKEAKTPAGASSRIAELDLSVVKKRREFLDALATANQLPEFNSDAALRGLTLSGELEKLRGQWLAGAAELENAKAEAVKAAVVPVYSEIIQRAVPAINPVNPGIRLRMAIWSVAGAGVGVLFALLAGRLRGDREERPRSAPPPPQPPPVEY